MKANVKKVKWYQFRLRAVFLILAILMTFGSYVGYRLYSVVRVRPMGTGPAGPAIAAAPFAEQWIDKDVVYIGIGDSITRAWSDQAPDVLSSADA